MGCQQVSQRKTNNGACHNYQQIARTKQTAQKLTGGKAPQKQLSTKVSRLNASRTDQEASLISPWFCCSPPNLPLPKEHRASYPQDVIPLSCKGSTAGFK